MPFREEVRSGTHRIDLKCCGALLQPTVSVAKPSAVLNTSSYSVNLSWDEFLMKEHFALGAFVALSLERKFWQSARQNFS